VTFAHENIAECYGYARDCGPLPALVMRYYPKGNITHYVTTETPSFDNRIQLVIVAVSCAYNFSTDASVDRSWTLRGDSSTYIHSNSPSCTETYAPYVYCRIISNDGFNGVAL
jgi:hypothetical protein